MNTPKIAFVTGATSGIGQAIARTLAPEFRLIICGRRQNRLDELRVELEAITEVKTLTFDVGDNKAVQDAVASLPTDWSTVDLLVNNAGNAHGRAPLHEGDIADWDAMIDSNLKGLLHVTRAILPNMVAAKSGDVINISSIAGKEAYENGNVYCATKFGVDAITKSMRMELIEHDIRVMSINPGLVNTEFSSVRFKGDEEKSSAVYEGMLPLLAQDIADVVHFAVNRPAHVNLADTTVLARAQASATKVFKK
ncbi:SDR family NAD(P)-dependent oxidoreductase [Reichenbachiella agarivorans]|uniref:SDR family NAD(P)-dependent oxidoreductase n=1 Tax=Reichenbachiella agarivorans TaxID=2979464 RepID=A0ABY6CRT9_9BACT|nr:SDR family NAD(P)-dependent oxidoreductase [Reichenbachiella agarivorans]UXP33064.1 SDR family NAD(P)-dependent oxidoreductase [Reichenbachiella agarivorans]